MSAFPTYLTQQPVLEGKAVNCIERTQLRKTHKAHLCQTATGTTYLRAAVKKNPCCLLAPRLKFWVSGTGMLCFDFLSFPGAPGAVVKFQRRVRTMGGSLAQPTELLNSWEGCFCQEAIASLRKHTEVGRLLGFSELGVGKKTHSVLLKMGVEVGKLFTPPYQMQLIPF